MSDFGRLSTYLVVIFRFLPHSFPSTVSSEELPTPHRSLSLQPKVPPKVVHALLLHPRKTRELLMFWVGWTWICRLLYVSPKGSVCVVSRGREGETSTRNLGDIDPVTTLLPG